MEERFNFRSLHKSRSGRYHFGVNSKREAPKRMTRRPIDDILKERTDNTMKETFGERLSRFRKQRGFTQEELGEKFGISGQAVSKWENDASMPDISILPELSDVLGVSLNELLGKEEITTRIVPAEERKDPNDLVLRIRVDSVDGDKVTVNLPMALVKAGIKLGMKMPQVSGNEALKDIDFEEIIKLVDEGLVGEIVTIESAEGDHVRIFVE